MNKIFAAAAMLLLIGAAPASAQFVPSKPIELVAHSGPGAGNDVFGRAIIATLEQEKLLPVRMQISNRVGGGGTTAASYMFSKKGDSHTLAVFTSVWISNPLVQEAANFKMQEMTPISRLVIEPGVIVVRTDAPYQSLKDFIEAARKNPGSLKQSGGSILARDSLVRQVLMAATGTRWAFISFPSGGERVSALLGGHVDLMILEPSEAGELIRGGKVRAVAQLSSKRVPGYEAVPTLKEAGFDVPEVPQARGLVGPPAMPADAVAYYENLLEKMTRSPAWQKQLKDNLLDDAFLKSKDTLTFLNDYETQLRGVLQAAGVKLVR